MITNNLILLHHMLLDYGLLYHNDRTYAFLIIVTVVMLLSCLQLIHIFVFFVYQVVFLFHVVKLLQIQQPLGRAIHLQEHLLD
ncbi:predicted protein [Arabidopsis lyrata subsp. lyrata]|uniref:Predicted protein n=1 Tax=Arabidopsis lyrata subsp. lyrata TaxID=81972 RepID=D7KQP3_ARALL|nr:predicted protein [Arabidopsis lyrata subsp. lyrata]